MTMRQYSILLAILTCASLSTAQVSFDAASVRPSTSNAGEEHGGPGTPDPVRISYTGITLQRLVMIAYGLSQPFQFSAPKWTEEARYDIVATLPGDAGQAQFRLMLQQLLAERFGMAVHHETRDLAGYELAVAKGGLKMKTAVGAVAVQPADVAAGQPSPAVFDRDKDGLPRLRPGIQNLVGMPLRTGGYRVSGRLQTSGDIAEFCIKAEGRPVVDKTGLSGVYDFDFDFSSSGVFQARPARPNAAGSDIHADLLPDFATAMQDALGLKLEAKTLAYDVLVVDQANRVPTAN